MPSICFVWDRSARSYLPCPFLAMAPDIGLPRTPNVHNIPPLQRPDVFDLDYEEDNEIDLPVEDEPDTGIDDADEPEERPDEAEEEEIQRRKDPAGDVLPPPPEKERHPDVDTPLPEPETERKRVPSLH
jgi:hypothetical protein